MLDRAIEASSSSTKVNTAFVERQNGTDRTYNARKRRKTYEFSKELLVYVAVTWWVVFCYNFHHLNRCLRLRLLDKSFLHRTPAMAMGLVDHPLSVPEILTTQLVGFMLLRAPTPAWFRTHHTSGPGP